MNKKTITQDIIIEGNFLVPASNKWVLYNRIHTIEHLGFMVGGYDKLQETKNVYRILCGGYFQSLDDLQLKFGKLTSTKWFYTNDSYLLINSEEIFCNGEWILKNWK